MYIPTCIAALFDSQREHYAPHPSAAFEGFYSKFRLPSGASVALIISQVPGADPRAAGRERERARDRSETGGDDEASAATGSYQASTSDGTLRRRQRSRSRVRAGDGGDGDGHGSSDALLDHQPDHDYDEAQRISKVDRGGAFGGDPPFLVSFTYVNADSTGWFQREFHPAELRVGVYDSVAHRTCRARRAKDGGGDGEDREQREDGDGDGDGEGGFTLSWPNGAFSWSGPQRDEISWDLDYPDLRFSARTATASASASNTAGSRSNRTPWIPHEPLSTPAGALARLPLPIQWHVHSLDSPCTYQLSFDVANPIKNAAATAPSTDDVHRQRHHPRDTPAPIPLHPLDAHGIAHAHIEKNWAASFPASYIWIQARDHERRSGLCVAGGSLVRGVQAYLVGYQSGHDETDADTDTITFAPPASTSIFSFSPTMRAHVDYRGSGPTEKSTVTLDIAGWRSRLEIRAEAAGDTFFTLSAPLAGGHRARYTGQSFAARVVVRRWTRVWGWGWRTPWPEFKDDGDGWRGLGWGWGLRWRWVEESGGDQSWDGASLEFGGGFYSDES